MLHHTPAFGYALIESSVEAIALSSKKDSSSHTRFTEKIVNMSKRGDFSSIRNSMKSFWENKNEHPWHRFCKTLDKELKGKNTEAVSERVLLIREAVFCALGMTSLSLALDVGTDHLLAIMTNEQSWKDGRRAVRSHCASLLKEKIESGDVACIVEVGLEKDDFGYLIPDLLESRIAKYRKAKPDTDAEKIDLTPLRKSLYGRRLLRSLNILEPSLSSSDDRVERLVEAYNHQMLELELSDSIDILSDEHTQQVTLNGSPVDDHAEKIREVDKIRSSAIDTDVSTQRDLTEYVTENLREIEHAGDLQALDGIGPAMESRLKESGYSSFVAIAHARAEELSEDVRGVGASRAEMLIKGARRILDGEDEGGEGN